MASRRTISYIGLWALIMPWLGFSWGTKTVLFSLTGILLLVIGNRHYHSSKTRNVNLENATKDKEPETKKEPVFEPVKPVMPVYKDIPEYMHTAPATVSHTSFEAETPKFQIKEEEIYIEKYSEPKDFNSEFSTEPSLLAVEEEKPKPKIRKRIEMVTRKRSSSKAISLDSLDSESNNE